jgi:integrase
MIQKASFFVSSIPQIRHFNYDLSKQWYIEFYDQDGKRQRVTSGKRFGVLGDGNRLKTKKERLTYFNAILSVLLSPSPPTTLELEKVQPIQEVSKKLSLDDAVNLFLDSKLRMIEPKTTKDYTSRLRGFALYCDFGKLEIDKVTRDEILQYLNRQEMSNTNYNNDLRVIKLLFNFLKSNDLVKFNSGQLVSYKPNDAEGNKPYNIEDAKRILEILKVIDRSLYICCLIQYYCFARPKEIGKLKWSDFDFEGKLLKIRANVNLKSKKVRFNPLSEKLINEIQEFRNIENSNSEYVFGDCRNDDYFKTKWQRIKNLLDVPNGCALYSFKHTGCCQLYIATRDIYLISRLCGHANIKTTEIYLRGLGVDLFNDNISKIPDL